MGDGGLFPTLDELLASADTSQTAVAPPAFESATLPAQISFQAQNVAPPSQLYITPADVIQVTIWNSLATEVDIGGRLMQSDGQVKTIFQPLFPTTNRIANTFTFRLSEGFLLDISAVTPNANIGRGQCFVQVVVVRGAGGQPFTVQTLLQDYVTSSAAAQWPGGLIRAATEGPGAVIAASATIGAGVEWSVTVPTNARWRLMSWYSVFRASATVATRTPNLEALAGSNVIYLVGSAAGVTASQTRGYSIGADLPNYTDSTGQNTQLPWPNSLYINAGQKISTLTGAIQAADQWTVIQYQYEEWISA